MFPADPPPSYVEAMDYQQLSRQLTQVKVDQHWNSLQNNSAETDQEEEFAKEQRRKKKNGLVNITDSCFNFTQLSSAELSLILQISGR